MNVNAISNASTVYSAQFTIAQNKVSNPFMMQNKADTVELSTKKEAPKSKLELAGEAFKKGVAEAGSSLKTKFNEGIDKAGAIADAQKQEPIQAYTSNVAVNTAFLGQALGGVTQAIANVAIGILEAVKVLVA